MISLQSAAKLMGGEDHLWAQLPDPLRPPINGGASAELLLAPFIPIRTTVLNVDTARSRNVPERERTTPCNQTALYLEIPINKKERPTRGRSFSKNRAAIPVES